MNKLAPDKKSIPMGLEEFVPNEVIHSIMIFQIKKKVSPIISNHEIAFNCWPN